MAGDLVTFDPAHLAAFAAASFIIGITPGPDIVYVLTRGAAQGAVAGLVAAVGLMTGLLGHVALSASGLSAVIAAAPLAFVAIKILGAAYLVWLGMGMWRAAPEALPQSGDGRRRAPGGDLSPDHRDGALESQTADFLPGLSAPIHPSGRGPFAWQFVFLGMVFIAVNAAVMGSAGILGGQAQRFLTGNAAAVQWTHRAAGSVLILLGVVLGLSLI